MLKELDPLLTSSLTYTSNPHLSKGFTKNQEGRLGEPLMVRERLVLVLVESECRDGHWGRRGEGIYVPPPFQTINKFKYGSSTPEHKTSMLNRGTSTAAKTK